MHWVIRVRVFVDKRMVNFSWRFVFMVLIFKLSLVTLELGLWCLTTFNNISVISLQSVLLVDEIGENHRPIASH